MTLHGHIPQKKSVYRRSKGGGLHLNADVRQEIDALILQARSEWKGRAPVEHPDMSIRFHIRNLRSDRDGKLVTLLDCLQKAGVIVNDNTAHCNGTITINPAVVDARERVEIEIR